MREKLELGKTLKTETEMAESIFTIAYPDIVGSYAKHVIVQIEPSNIKVPRTER